HDLTAPDGLLGGGLPSYNLYPTRDGWIALAALELHFWYRLQKELELDNPTYSELAAVFNSRTAREWEAWAVERDLPLRMVQPSH
ncbi:MAG: CoA transferase, partial [Chloroflexota bacterium]|nr:CoA transferase [Chloroflexota bacterium]